MGKQSREKKSRREGGQGNEEIQEREARYEYKTGPEKACLFIITWAAYLTLFVPLLISPQFFFPFVAPKSILFRILVEIIFAAYLFLAVSNKKYRPRITLLTLTLFLFLAVFIISSFAGANLTRSFWSTYERMTGIWTMLHLFAFFIVLSSVFKRKEDWEKFLGVSVLAGVSLSLYIMKGDEVSTRGGGTIGNTSFMAAYLLFNVFFALILLLSNFLKKGGWSVFWQIFSGLSLLAMLPILFDSSARGAIAFFEMGIFLLALGYSLFSGKKILKKAGLILIFLLIISAVAAFALRPEFLDKKINSLLNDMRPRFAVWQIGYEGWKERPLLGWGPENFNISFGEKFNPCLFTPKCGGEIWFDRVHNIVLDTLVATGLIGLLSYLAVFGAVFWLIFRTLPKIAEKRNIFFPLGLGVLLAVYFGQNLLVFDMINTYLVFFASLALINFLTMDSVGKIEQEDFSKRRVNPIFGSMIILFTAFFLWFGNIKPAIAGDYIVKMLATQDMQKGMEYFQKSLDSWMYKYEAREQFAQKMGNVIYQPIKEKDSPVFQKAFEMVETEMEKSALENPLDLRANLFLGRLYAIFFQFSGDQEKLLLAQKKFEESIAISPGNQQGYWYLAEVKLGQKKNQEAIDLLKKAIELEPLYERSYWYLTRAYEVTGQYQLALETLTQAEKTGYDWRAELGDIKEVIKIYVGLNDDANIMSACLRALELAPRDVAIWSSLAASYANLGQIEKAREAANKVVEIDPSLKSKVEEFLNLLP